MITIIVVILTIKKYRNQNQIGYQLRNEFKTYNTFIYKYHQIVDLSIKEN